MDEDEPNTNSSSLDSVFEDLERKDDWLKKRLEEANTASERNHYITMSQVKYELGAFEADYEPLKPGTLEPKDDPIASPSLWTIRTDAQESRLNSAATLDLLTNPTDADKHEPRLASIEGQIRDIKLYIVVMFAVICFLFYWYG